MTDRRLIILVVVRFLLLAVIVCAVTWCFISLFMKKSAVAYLSTEVASAVDSSADAENSRPVELNDAEFAAKVQAEVQNEAEGFSSYFLFEHGACTDDYSERLSDISKYIDSGYLKSLSSGIQRIGVSAVDLRNGVEFGENRHDYFLAASTTKFTIAMLACDYVEEGIIGFDDLVFYAEKYDYEDGSGVLVGNIIEGQSLSVAELIDLAIKDSDNIALNMLARKLVLSEGAERYVEGFVRILGRYDEQNIYTPHELMRSAVYYFENYPIKKSYSVISASLEVTKMNDFVTALLPEGSYVHKFGVVYGDKSYSCDVGIIRGENPIAFGVMSEWTGEPPYAALNDLGETLLSVVLGGSTGNLFLEGLD